MHRYVNSERIISAHPLKLWNSCVTLWNILLYWKCLSVTSTNPRVVSFYKHIDTYSIKLSIFYSFYTLLPKLWKVKLFIQNSNSKPVSHTLSLSCIRTNFAERNELECYMILCSTNTHTHKRTRQLQSANFKRTNKRFQHFHSLSLSLGSTTQNFEFNGLYKIH